MTSHALPIQEVGKGFHSTATSSIRTVSKTLMWGVDQNTTHCRVRVESPTNTQLPSSQHIHYLTAWLDKMPGLHTVSLKIASDWIVVSHPTPEVVLVAQLLSSRSSITKLNLLSGRDKNGCFQALHPLFASTLVNSMRQLRSLAIDVNSHLPRFDISTCLNLRRIDFLGHFHSKGISSLPVSVEALSANTMFTTPAADFSALTRLSALSFSLISQSLASCLKGLTGLQELHVDLGHCNDLSVLSSHTNLQSMTLCAPHVATLDVLGQLPHLVDLGLRCSSLHSVAFLADATSLTRLRLFELQALPSLLLPRASHLSTLSLGQQDFGGESYTKLLLISTIKSIRRLDLNWSVGLHGERVLPLTSLTRLSALNLSNSVLLCADSIKLLVDSLADLVVLRLHGCDRLVSASTIGAWVDTDDMLTTHRVTKFVC